jgi:putative ABC transport system substrate-binding protein
MKTRREFLVAGVGLCILASPLSSRAQQTNKVWRIGFLYNGSRESAMSTGRYPAFLEGMRQLGYVEEKHFVVEARFAPDDEVGRLPALAVELVRSGVDVIVTTGVTASRALQQATSTIPIVMTLASDPVREGIGASLAHPGGNITGLSAFQDDVYAKHVEMLKLAVPKLSRIAALANSRSAIHPYLL